MGRGRYGEGMGSDELLAFCRVHGLEVRLLRPGVPTPTVPEAAAAVGVEPARVVKSLVFLHGSQPLLLIAAGVDRIAYPHVAAALATSRRQVRLATPDEALAIAGYPVGAMPPFGHRFPLPTLIDDRRFPTDGVVVAGGGARDALLEVAPADLLRVTAARLVPLGPPLATESRLGEPR